MVLKTTFNKVVPASRALAAVLALGLGLAGVARAQAPASPSATANPASPKTGDGLRQIAGILDYIGGDYRGAVGTDGQILDRAEYDEQLTLAKDADALAGAAGDAADSPVRVALQALTAALQERHVPEQVQQLCRTARDVLVKTHGLVLTPASPPSRDEAVRLYFSSGCNGCHADDGSAKTPAAAALDPQPANFLDAERVATVSAHRAFHALTFGVPGTAMLAYAQLSDAQRWGLAFYVLSLRHVNQDIGLGRRLFEDSELKLPHDAATLSALSEEELIASLKTLPNPQERDAALAYLRVEAPFAQAGGGTLALALSTLEDGVKAYSAGDALGARKLFIAAYLDGFEPHEAGLRAREPELVSQIERAMLALRVATSENVPKPEVEALAKQARLLLLRAQNTGSNASTALFGALTITLREGLEIVLLVAALLGLVRKRGQPELARYVHAGWLLAIPFGLATYYALGSVLGGMQREMAEGIASLLAAVVLLGVTHWLIGQVSAKKWVGMIARGVTSATSGTKAGLFVMGLSFIAAYREAFEIVLFYQALILDAASHVSQIWLGTAIGLAVLGVTALVLLRVGQKLRPAPFMLASSVFLAILSFMLVGKGVRALQEAGALDVKPLPLPEVQWLGIFATREGLIAQAVLALLLLGSALWPWYAARRAAERGRVATSVR